MSPSEERSSSAVRNLRSLFENKASEPTTPGRGRSPGDLIGDDEPRPRSKIRASFIAVDSPDGKLPMTMATAPDFSKIPNSDAKNTIDATPALNREPTTGRRTSFSEKPNSDALQALKATVAEEGERRKSQAVGETVPETAVETPLVEADKQLGAPKRTPSPKKATSPLKRVENSSSSSPVDKEANNPDKPLMGAEEEPAKMTPADPTSASAVSGGKALPSAAEDLRKTAVKPASKSNTAKPAPKLAAAVTAASKAPRPSTGPKSPQPTTASPRSPTSPKPVTKKTSRPSLAVPTTASSAKTAAPEKAAPKPASSAAKPKPRETTKPVEISSRLTAPTAASRARVEGPSAPASKPATSASRSRPNSSARPSLGRPESRGSATGTKKPSAPVDGSFLERMTRPTAAFANRTAKETEAKATNTLKQKLPSRPKTNGQAKEPSSSGGASAETTEENIIHEPSVVHEGSEVGDSTEKAQDAAADNRPGSPTGDHTPVVAPATNGDHKAEVTIDTPAAVEVDETAR